ncbi:MAG: glycosyltransferase family 39 protein [Gemmatimonadales bacterium]
MRGIPPTGSSGLSGWAHTLNHWLDDPRILQGLTIAIFALAVGFRIALAMLNLEANDNHMAVSQVMAFENRIPDETELHQSYHPKLFHGTAALIWRILPDPSLENATRAAQLLNAVAGIVTILAALALLRRLNLSPRTLVLAFGFIALNPRLIAINVQAANDSFVILFGALTLFFGYRFFEHWRWTHFLGMLASAVLATLSKSSGLVLFLGVAGVFGLALAGGRRLAPCVPRRAAAYGVLFVAAYLVLAGWLGPYWGYYREYGTPLISNHETPPFPYFFKKTYYGRPGVTSIAQTLLTFRLIDLIRHPISSQQKDTYPIHRTSLWSHVYGSTHFSRFDSHPQTWRTRSRIVHWWGRAILILALFPTALLVSGMVRWAVRLGRDWIKATRRRESLSEALLLLAFAGIVAAICFYALRQRSFTSMKAIYIFPAMLGALAIFAVEYDRLISRLRPSLRLAAESAIAALLVLYLGDIAILTYQLR